VKTYSWDNAQVVLVGNKCDLEDERVVSTERGRQLASQMGMIWISVIWVVLFSNHTEVNFSCVPVGHLAGGACTACC